MLRLASTVEFEGYGEELQDNLTIYIFLHAYGVIICMDTELYFPAYPWILKYIYKYIYIYKYTSGQHQEYPGANCNDPKGFNTRSGIRVLVLRICL